VYQVPPADSTNTIQTIKLKTNRGNPALGLGRPVSVGASVTGVGLSSILISRPTAHKAAVQARRIVIPASS